jgi:hypothetical protein
MAKMLLKFHYHPKSNLLPDFFPHMLDTDLRHLYSTPKFQVSAHLSQEQLQGLIEESLHLIQRDFLEVDCIGFHTVQIIKL